LIQPTIAPSQTEVEQGGTVNIVGEDFNTGFSGKVNLSWLENNSLPITTTEFRGEPQGNPMSKPRTPNDNGNEVTLTNIVPNASYDFSVQDCDISCTGWSNVVSYKSGPAISAALQLNLQQPGKSIPVGSASVGANRSFSTTIRLDPTVPLGNYSLVAERSGAIEATAPLMVVKVGQFTPVIKFIDRTLGTSSSSERVGVGDNITIRGEGFASGPVRISLDTLNGTALATAVATGSPTMFEVTFQYNAATGNHQIVASQTQGGRVLQATGTIDAQSTH
jgi:hypothetical protein